MKKVSIITALVFLILSTAGSATATMLGSDQSGNLFSVNLTTGVQTFIGTEGQFPLATEIEYDAGTGTLYSQGINGSFMLHTVNPATGLSTGFVNTSGAFNGLEAVGATLYGTEILGPAGPSTLVSINPLTGIGTPVAFPTGFGPISGLAYDGMTMYGVTAGGVPADLVSINLLTGLATVIAPLMDPAGAPLMRVGSIEFGANGVLYGGLGLNSIAPGQLLSINTATGTTTFIGGPQQFAYTGLTETTAVPEPSTILLLGAGLLGVAGIARRRKG